MTVGGIDRRDLTAGPLLAGVTGTGRYTIQGSITY